MISEKFILKDSENNVVFGVLSTPSENFCGPVVILASGFSSSKDGRTCIAFEKEFIARNIAVFRFDFYGHGESDGELSDVTVSKAKENVLLVVDFVKSKGFRKMGLIGSSFGGSASILAMAESPGILVLGLSAPVIDYGRRFSVDTKYNVEEWKKTGLFEYIDGKGKHKKLNYSFYQDAVKLDGFAALQKIFVPTLIVHGTEDGVLTKQSTEAINLLSNGKLELVNGADHYFSREEDYEKRIELLVDFIVRNLKEKEIKN